MILFRTADGERVFVHGDRAVRNGWVLIDDAWPGGFGRRVFEGTISALDGRELPSPRHMERTIRLSPRDYQRWLRIWDRRRAAA